jgi:hypothetical protein
MKKRLLTSSLLTIFVYVASGLSDAQDWTPWQKLDDGALNGIEFSYRDNCPPTGAVDCNHLWRFSSGYESDVTVEYTIAWETGSGIKEKTARTVLKPGENMDDSFSVAGKALDEVSVKIIAEKEVLAAARRQVESERRLMEETQRQAEEIARKQEEPGRGVEETPRGTIKQASAPKKSSSTKYRRTHAERIRSEERYLQQQEQPRPRKTVMDERRRREEARANARRKMAHRRYLAAKAMSVQSVPERHLAENVPESPATINFMKFEKYLDSEILGHNNCL